MDFEQGCPSQECQSYTISYVDYRFPVHNSMLGLMMKINRVRGGGVINHNQVRNKQPEQASEDRDALVVGVQAQQRHDGTELGEGIQPEIQICILNSSRNTFVANFQEVVTTRLG